MTIRPEFSEFRPIELEDRDFFKDILWKYQPQTSEWTFANLFIWRSHYQFQWSMYQQWLLVFCTVSGNVFFALLPVGFPSRPEGTRTFLQWLKDEKREKKSRIERAVQKLISEIEDARNLMVEPTRDHFDYVYRTQDLIKLVGRKCHSKRNHINKLPRSSSFT